MRWWANALSLSRIVFGGAAYLSLSGSAGAAGGPTARGTVVCLALVLAAALTDYLDGVLARRVSPQSAAPSGTWFGRWIDAFADFWLFFCVYSALLRLELMPAWLYAPFLAREGMMYLLIRPAAVRLNLDHGARLPGKIKTGLQYAGTTGLLALLALAPRLGLSPSTVDTIVVSTLAVLVATSAASLYWYLRPIFTSWPPHQRGLPQQLCATLAGLAVLQVLLYRVLAPSQAPWDLFLIAIALFHVALGGFLFWRHEEFASRDSGRDSAAGLSRLTLPNVLTLLRLSSTPTLTLLLAHGPRAGTVPALVVMTGLMFLTDLLDGALARRRGQVTRIGGYLDSGSDYLVLLSLAGLLALQGVMPRWLAGLLAVRLVAQALAMSLIVLRHGVDAATPTTWGKISVAAAMVIVTLELLAYAAYSGGLSPTLLLQRGLRIAELLVALLLGISLVDKLRYFLRAMKSAPRFRSPPESTTIAPDS